MTLPKGNQIAAARALLGWDQKEVAERVGVSVAAISKIEKGENKGKASTLEKIQTALELAGIEFLPGEGLRKKESDVRVFRGREDFNLFFDDVYTVVKNHPDPNVCITSVKEDEYVFWHGEKSSLMHRKRMIDLKRAPLRVLVKEDHDHDMTFRYCKYRYVKESQFSHTSTYVYGDKSAFIQFSKDDVVVTMVDNASIADSMRKMFDAVWDMATDYEGQ